MQKYSDIILKIQEYADKTLQFGCIVDVDGLGLNVPTSYLRVVSTGDNQLLLYAGHHNLEDYKERAGNTIYDDQSKIIGLPMDMNRVNYLYLFYQKFCKEITEDVKLTMQYNYYHITAALEKNPNLYNLNVFDRQEEFVKLVYDMLRLAPVIQKN